MKDIFRLIIKSGVDGFVGFFILAWEIVKWPFTNLDNKLKQMVLIAIFAPLLGAWLMYAWIKFEEPKCLEQHPKNHYCVRWEK